MEERHDNCTVFFNYSKVFDSVPHRLLPQKLKTVVFTNRSLDGLPIISAHVLIMSINSLGRLATNTCCFLCDMQEKFRPSICYFPEIISIARHVVGYLMYTIASTFICVNRSDKHLTCVIWRTTPSPVPVLDLISKSLHSRLFLL